MTARITQGLSSQARNLHWLLTNLVEEVPGLLSVAVVSSDGVLLLSSDSAAPVAASGSAPSSEAGGGPGIPVRAPEAPETPKTRGPKGTVGDLATIVSGLGSLTVGAAKLMDGGRVRQTMVAMEEGSLFVTAISDGSLLGAHATPDCDMSVVAYHMALFVGRAGHVLTPEVRGELRRSLDAGGAPVAGLVPGARGPLAEEAPVRLGGAE